MCSRSSKWNKTIWISLLTGHQWVVQKLSLYKCKSSSITPHEFQICKVEEKVTEVKGGYALFIYSKNCIGYLSIKLTQLVDSQFYVLFMITEVIHVYYF